MSKATEKLGLISSNIAMAARSLLWKKDSSVVLVGAWFGEKFADNSRYLYQYLSEKKEELGLTHVVWVTANEAVCHELNDMGYEAYMFGTDESIKYHKLAKYHIICNAASTRTIRGADGKEKEILGDIEGQYSWRAKRINLWHGTGGLKAINMSSNVYKKMREKHPVLYAMKEFLLIHSRLYQRFCVLEGGWGFCYQIATSPLQIKTLHENIGRNINMCIETSYPRNCVCPRLLPQEEKVLETIKRFKYTILYLPTFRSNSQFNRLNVSEDLLDILEKNNILWIEKPHSADLQEDIPQQSSDNILKLDKNFDINVLMQHITLLITDYSSVRMDAMFHDKATLFYVPDFDEYLRGDNGFMANPNEVMCGPRLFNIEELRLAIQEYVYFPEKSKTKNYQEIKHRYWSKNEDISQIWEDIKRVVE